MNRLSIISYYKWKILFWSILFSLIGAALVYGPEYGINQRIVVFITLVLGIFTQVFTGITSLIALIPFFGPFILKVISIPIFYIVNDLFPSFYTKIDIYIWHSNPIWINRS